MNCIDQVVTDRYTAVHGDCVEALQGLPDHCIGYSIFSPPFASLYTYSNSPRDMGNVRNDAEFFDHLDYLIVQLARVLKPGRNVSFHCMDMPASKERDGYIGLKDFPGDLIRAFQRRGFIFHSKATIWKDPVTAMQRTKALGLLHKSVRENSAMCRQGIPDYLVTMRAPGECERVTHTADEYPVDLWQRVASPVWMDINPSDTLQYMSAREHDDERHICLARGSLVLTRERGYVPIETVQVGEHALTHRGRWRPVLVARKTGEREVVDLRAQGVSGLRLTPDHKLWARLAEGSRERDAAEKAEPGWLAAEESVGHYINLKLPPVEASPLSQQECWIVGRWLADGHRGARGDFHISVGAHKMAEFEAMAGQYAGTRAERTAIQVRLKELPDHLRNVLSRCGSGAENKQIPAELLTMDTASSAALLDGYLSGDGHFVASRGRWMATSVSRALLLGVAMLAQRVHGAIPALAPGRAAGEAVIEGRSVHTKQEWVLSFDIDIAARRKQPFIVDDGAWKKVRSADPAGVAEVWCLRVDEDESFTAEGCIVKNCPLQLEVIRRGIALWCNPGDIVLSPFMGIGSEGYVALQMGRRFVGIELKASYYQQAVGNLAASLAKTADLFATEEAA